MSVTWTLKDASGANLSHQPSGGSPLALKFNSSGYPHLSGYPSEIICTVECEADTSNVSVNLTPDTAGDTLSEELSRALETPSAHGGTLTWTNGSNGLTTLTTTVSTMVGQQWCWDLGLAEPAVGLKIKLKIKRI